MILKNSTTALLLSFFFGILGIDRFYICDILLGFVKLITLGCCDIWWFIDLFLIWGDAQNKNYAKVMSVLQC